MVSKICLLRRRNFLINELISLIDTRAHKSAWSKTGKKELFFLLNKTKTCTKLNRSALYTENHVCGNHGLAVLFIKPLQFVSIVWNADFL